MKKYATVACVVCLCACAYMCVCVCVHVCVCVQHVSVFTCAHTTLFPFQQEPKWKVIIKCALQLIIGVGMVTLFSDPMVDALTDLTDHSHESGTYTDISDSSLPVRHYNWGSHVPIGSKLLIILITFDNHALTVTAFYVSFVVTPLCSNASELVSSLIFASKKTKVNSSMTYSQVNTQHCFC